MTAVHDCPGVKTVTLAQVPPVPGEDPPLNPNGAAGRVPSVGLVAFTPPVFVMVKVLSREDPTAKVPKLKVGPSENTSNAGAAPVPVIARVAVRETAPSL